MVLFDGRLGCLFVTWIGPIPGFHVPRHNAEYLQSDRIVGVASHDHLKVLLKQHKAHNMPRRMQMKLSK